MTSFHYIRGLNAVKIFKPLQNSRLDNVIFFIMNKNKRASVKMSP